MSGAEPRVEFAPELDVERLVRVLADHEVDADCARERAKDGRPRRR